MNNNTIIWKMLFSSKTMCFYMVFDPSHTLRFHRDPTIPDTNK